MFKIVWSHDDRERVVAALRAWQKHKVGEHMWVNDLTTDTAIARGLLVRPSMFGANVDPDIEIVKGMFPEEPVP